MTPEQRRIGVPLVVITASKWSRPDGWSDETFAAFQARMRASHDEIASRSPHAKRIDVPTSHSVQLEAPEPIRRLGGGLVRAAIMACEEAEEEERRPPLSARVGAALPRLLGLRIGTR